MSIQEIYELGIEMGMKADPRGIARVKKLLERAKKDYKELSDKKKKYFDPETLKNPYSDSRILNGDPKKQVKKLMAGIDAEVAEVLLVDRLNQTGAKIDLLISHHPDAQALASLHEVMDVHVDMYAEAGVPENVAHALLEERRAYVQRRFSPLNHTRSVDAAKLLNIPLLALHTIWDNLGNEFLKDYLSKKSFETVGEVLEYINEIPEFVEAQKGKAGPFLAAGAPHRRAGKIIVSFTGGTNPSKEMDIELAKAGVGTIVDMHIGEDSLTELKKHHVNVIDCGHMAADSVGANIFLDQLEKRGIEIVPSSGLIRVSRLKKS